METMTIHSNHIDIKHPVSKELSLLEETCVSRKSADGPGISRLIGSARPKGMDLSSIEDDRLQYLLSK